METGKSRFEDMAYGPIGVAVKAAMPHTEADPIGVLAAVLALYSSALNGHVTQPNGRPVVVWTALAGRSKIGRKGFALSTAEAILEPSIGRFYETQRRQGVTSGPSLVTTLYEAEQDSLTSEAGLDGRIVIVDEEWSTTLRMANRCPKYSGVLRTSWDGKRVANTTKGKDGKREEQAINQPRLGFHVHIQPGAWAKYISTTEALGGSYNRILPVIVERSKLLPTMDENPLENIRVSKSLTAAYDWARKERRTMVLSPAARKRYDELRAEYEDQMAEMPESVSCFIERSDEQVLRVACVLTAAWKKAIIPLEAIEAARSFVEFSMDSVRQLVTESAAATARPVISLEQRIAKALKERGPLASTALYRALGSGRFTAAQIQAAAEEMPDVEIVRPLTTRPGTKPVVYQLVQVEPEPEPEPVSPPARRRTAKPKPAAKPAVPAARTRRAKKVPAVSVTA